MRPYATTDFHYVIKVGYGMDGVTQSSRYAPQIERSIVSPRTRRDLRARLHSVLTLLF
jgi:hypothetical protein